MIKTPTKELFATRIRRHCLNRFGPHPHHQVGTRKKSRLFDKLLSLEANRLGHRPRGLPARRLGGKLLIEHRFVADARFPVGWKEKVVTRLPHSNLN